MRILTVIEQANMISVDGKWIDCPALLKKAAKEIRARMTDGKSFREATGQTRLVERCIEYHGLNNDIVLTLYNVLSAKPLADEELGSFLAFYSDNGVDRHCKLRFYHAEQVLGNPPEQQG